MELSRHQREVYGSGMSDRGMLAILGPCEPCSCCTSTAASPKSHPQGDVRTPSPAGLQSIRHRRGAPERAGGCGGWDGGLGCGAGMRGVGWGGGMRGAGCGVGMRGVRCGVGMRGVGWGRWNAEDGMQRVGCGLGDAGGGIEG